MTQRSHPHDRCVNDLSGQHGYGLTQDDGAPVAPRQLDPQRACFAHDDRTLRRSEVVVLHVGDVRLRVRRPRTHPVRMRPGVALHRGGRTPVRVPLAQDRVDGAAHDLVVAGTDVAILVALGSSGYSGSGYPCCCNSRIAALSWGLEAETFGSLMMLASGVFASSPSSARASGLR